MSNFGIAPYKSEFNSSSTILGAGATFTGVLEQTDRSMLLIQSFSDVGGTLFIDFSVDGINVDSTFPVGGTAALPSAPLVVPVSVGGRWFRVRYMNGASPQITFRLGIFVCDITGFYSPLNQPYTLSAPSTITRSTFTWLDVSRGLMQGMQSIKKLGRNDAVGTSFVPVSLGGIYQAPLSSAATTLRVKAGGNANDTAAGSGARSVTISGLDQNFLPVQATLATAGASASASTSITFTRVFDVEVASSGTYATALTGSHAGSITIENTAGTLNWGVIDANGFPKGKGEIACYTIPAGLTGFVKVRHVSVDSGKTADIFLFSRANCDALVAPFSAMKAQSVVVGINGGNVDNYGEVDVPMGPYVGPTDIGFLSKTSVGTASVSIEFEIFLVAI